MKTFFVIIIVIIISAWYIITKKKPIIKPDVPKEAEAVKYKFYDIIQKASNKYNIPASRIFGHIMQESSGNPNSVGLIGERGLMQLRQIAYADVQKNFQEFKGIGFERLWEPDINIMAGTAYLSLCRRWVGGDLDKASQAYNAGIGNVLKGSNLGIVYVEKVKTYEAMV